MRGGLNRVSVALRAPHRSDTVGSGMERLRRFIGSGRAFLFSYFIAVITIGSVLLSLPAAWPGPGGIRIIDAVFTATSAVCVTGLITVNTAEFTRFGQTVIMLIIQAGGLGIIAFSTIYLVIPVSRMSLRSSTIIQEYYVDQVDFDPKRIVRSIVRFTVAVQAAGVILLGVAFSHAGIEAPLFTAVFHTISAFCNAGFSTFPDSLERFVFNHAVTLPIMALIIVGGIGFVVLQDLTSGRVRGRRRSLHTKVVLATTAALIVLGTVLFFAFERGDGVFAGMSSGRAAMAALFQSVTPRTAGFNTVDQGALSPASLLLTIVFMFTGGAPGSVAGGIKVTTVLVVLAAAVVIADENGDIRLGQRRIPASLVGKAHGLLIKALLIVLVSSLLLTITERALLHEGTALVVLLFEAFSAFGTVGLSMGITDSLSDAGKLVIIFTMFAGRVGLISLAMPRTRRRGERLIGYPTGEILIG